MPKIKLPKPIKDEAVLFVSMQDVAREAGNAANRQKTVLKNAIKDYWAREDIPVGSYVKFGGFKFAYEAAETTSYDTDAILAMYDNEEITREQMLRFMKVDSKQLTNALGSDMEMDLQVKTLGDKPDIRVERLPVEEDADEYIMVERRVREKKKRSVFGKRVAEKALQSTASSNGGKRKIKFRGKK